MPMAIALMPPGRSPPRADSWLLSLDVDPSKWESHSDAYYADPAREALDPDPARLIESQRRALVVPVDF